MTAVDPEVPLSRKTRYETTSSWLARLTFFEVIESQMFVSDLSGRSCHRAASASTVLS